MLPADKDISRSISFLRGANISGKIVISLSLTSPDKDKKDLILAVDELAARLGPPLFSDVSVGLSELEITKSMDFFLDNIPQILSAKDLSNIDSQINPESISKNLENIYRQTLKPGGLFMNSVVRSDPLGLRLIVFNKLKALSARMGYNVNIEDGHFISKDGKHAMIIAKTPILVTDIIGGEKLFSALDKQFEQLPDYISASTISGHSHTLSNKRVMSRDILLTSIITAVVFLMLFVVILRELGSIIIFLIPLSSVILAINLYSFFWGRLSYSVVGLGAVLAGISVDYAIHVYIAVKKGGDTFNSVKHVRLPVFAGALTTIALFVAFFLSEIKGYHQLAVFSILSISLAFIYSLFIMPHFLPAGVLFPGLDRFNTKKWGNLNGSNNLSVAIWAVLTLIFLILSFRIKLDSDIKKIDGTEAEIIQAEARFHSIWGQNKFGIFVATGKSYEEALKLNDTIYQEAAKLIGAENFSSLSMLWPSEETRKENIARWKQFWKEGREERLKKLLREKGSKHQFSQDAFSPFFNNLHNYQDIAVGDLPLQNKFFSALKERFVQKQHDEYQIVSFFPEEEDNVAALLNLSKRYPETFIVSGTVLSDAISRGVLRNIKRIIPIAVMLLVVLTYLCLWNIKETIITLVPVATSFAWLLGIMPLLGLTLNGANLIACVILLGICVDYGIFMTYKSRRNLAVGTNLAVALAAVTTIIGAGSLVFAKHPALFSVGVTMFIGVSTGYLSSVFVVPQLSAIFLSPVNIKEKL